MGKNHAACLELLRDLWDESAWITMLDDQMAACRLESLADLRDCRMNKGNPTILARHLCSRAGQGGENRLIEYKRYKSVLEDLRRLEELRAFMNPRGFATAEIRQLAEQALADAELESISLYKLLRVFERLVARFDEAQKSKRVHTVYNYNYTIQEQREYLVSSLKKDEKRDFEQLFLTLENRLHAVVTFLALLELLNAQEVVLIQGEGMNNFWLTLPEEATTEEVA